jgi:hypothetical protein
MRYSVTPHPIETLLTWVKSGEIAIPEIQRPFVWDAIKVRNLLDSLYRGYPVGYLITWRNPTVKLKDGTLSAGKRILSAGKRILIDGQQRITALMAALLGRKASPRTTIPSASGLPSTRKKSALRSATPPSRKILPGWRMSPSCSRPPQAFSRS